MQVGKRLDLSFPGYVIQLLAGNTVIAQDNSSLNPASGQFLLSTINYQSLASDPFAGQNLKIVLSANGVQAEFDAVSLTSTPANGPTSVTISNPGFESDVLAAGADTYNTFAAGWTCNPLGCGAFHPNASQLGPYRKDSTLHILTKARSPRSYPRLWPRTPCTL